MKFKVVNADRAIGLSAMLVSLLTLFIFLYQTSLLREQSRLSVRPRLSFSKNISHSITISGSDSVESTLTILSLSLRNNGLGPAIIDSHNIVQDDSIYDVFDFFQYRYPKLREFGVFRKISQLEEGGALPSSTSTEIFTYEYDLSNESKIKDYLNVSSGHDWPFVVEVQYSSMYNEQWMVQSNSSGHPRRVN